MIVAAQNETDVWPLTAPPWSAVPLLYLLNAAFNPRVITVTKTIAITVRKIGDSVIAKTVLALIASSLSKNNKNPTITEFIAVSKQLQPIHL